MLHLSANDRHRYCDGLSRRSFLKAGALSIAGLSLADLLRARAQATQAGTPTRNTAVILVWLDGGPTHMDTYDLKPNAPMEYRGPMQGTQTNVPGIQICSLMPRQAAIADKLAIVRSLAHTTGDHFAGAHWMLTGYHGSNAARLEPMYPSIGAYTARIRGANRAGMPAHVAIPYSMTVGLRPGYLSGAYLGSTYNAFETNGDPNAAAFSVQNVTLPGGLTLGQVQERRTLLGAFDNLQREIDQSGLAANMDTFQQQAFDMVTSPQARDAFDINQEPPHLRDRYGRHTWGQSCLLARRLVEAGVTFVSIHMGGWDDHAQIGNAMNNKLPIYDRAFGTLVEDLCDRGMYDDVAVCVCGEFGRTPRVNNDAGRDHWGQSGFCILGGGGLHTGLAVGATNDRGERPATRPVSPGDMLATLYRVLGINHHQTFLDHSGRPHEMLRDGQAIPELV
jgi:hypothetical protein